ncbi:MAG: Co2+/Mg2+ efflux protein ApaG [Leptonema sp. (in: Bacteria)]|nr:Co2+/Mg2+ efflux protein ApaG [Leptonema sp. (in: bacteria)]
MSQLEQITVGGGIRIQAYPVYLPTQSMPEENRYFFSYTIEITNERLQPVQLISRYWLIINADGESQEVSGPGVVGKTPLIQPNESFVYTSFCPLNTSWGTMEGKYTMNDSDGNLFEVVIPRFVLAWDADTISE